MPLRNNEETHSCLYKNNTTCSRCSYCIGKQGARLISRSMEFANLVLFLATNLPPTKMWNGMCCFLTQTMLFLFHMPHILKNHLDVSNVRMINETRLGRLVTERIKNDAQNDMYNSYMWLITMKNYRRTKMIMYFYIHPLSHGSTQGWCSCWPCHLSLTLNIFWI